ncbi:MAG: hypothetical protein Q9196_006520, partial [Gyalolechia fulgens]
MPYFGFAMLRLATLALFLTPSVFATELVSPTPTSDNEGHPVVLVLVTPAPQPQLPYLELKHLDLDRRQIKPAAAGAPAAAAAGAQQQPAAPAPLAAVPDPAVAPAAPAAAAPAPVAAAPVAPAPAAPAPAPDGLVGAHGSVQIHQGPATALTTAPSAMVGTIGMGTLTGEVGVVRTREARSEAGSAMDSRFGFVASWPSSFKIGASVLVGTA